MSNAVELLVAKTGTQRALAKLLKIRPQAITKWQRSGIPAIRVLQLERLTGVSRHELRPDIYPREPARRSELRA